LSYFEEIRKAMKLLAEDDRTLFVGQSVCYPGHALYKTLQDEDGKFLVLMEQRIEMPVIEDFQMGCCTGLALMGYIPVCIFPRMDFLLLAANQLVTHLDKIPLQSDFRPKVIIRTAVGATIPLNSGWQHTSNHTKAFREMLRTVRVAELTDAGQIVSTYRRALVDEYSYLIVEHQNFYNS